MPPQNHPRMGAAATRRIAAVKRSIPGLATFGGVGALAFIVDFLTFNLLRLGPLAHQTITAKVISVAVATLVAWLGNRYLTFRSQRTRPVWREGALFVISNLIGLAIAAGCLFVSHYLLGLVSPLADNIAANGVGLLLGTTFRYFAYRFFVFPNAAPAASAAAPSPATPSPATPSPASGGSPA